MSSVARNTLLVFAKSYLFANATARPGAMNAKRDEARGKISRNEFVDTGKVNNIGAPWRLSLQLSRIAARCPVSAWPFFFLETRLLLPILRIDRREADVVNRETETPRRDLNALRRVAMTYRQAAVENCIVTPSSTVPLPAVCNPVFRICFCWIRTANMCARRRFFTRTQPAHLSANLIRGRSGIPTKTLRII